MMPLIQGEILLSVEDLKKASEQSQAGQAPIVRVAVHVSSEELWHALRAALTDRSYAVGLELADRRA